MESRGDFFKSFGDVKKDEKKVGGIKKAFEVLDKTSRRILYLKYFKNIKDPEKISQRNLFLALQKISQETGLKLGYIIFYFEKYQEELKEELEVIENRNKEEVEDLYGVIYKLNLAYKEYFVRYYILKQSLSEISEQRGVRKKNVGQILKKVLEEVEKLAPENEVLNNILKGEASLAPKEVIRFKEILDPVFKQDRAEFIENDLREFTKFLWLELTPTELNVFIDFELRGLAEQEVIRRRGTTEGGIRDAYNSIFNKAEAFVDNPNWWQRGELGRYLKNSVKQELLNSLNKRDVHEDALVGASNFDYFRMQMKLTHEYNWLPYMEDLTFYEDKRLTNTQKKTFDTWIKASINQSQKSERRGDLVYILKKMENFVIHYPFWDIALKTRILGTNFDIKGFDRAVKNEVFISKLRKLRRQSSKLEEETSRFIKHPYVHQNHLYPTQVQKEVLELTVRNNIKPREITEFINKNPDAYENLELPVSFHTVKNSRLTAIRNLALFLRMNFKVSLEDQEKLFGSIIPKQEYEAEERFSY